MLSTTASAFRGSGKLYPWQTTATRGTLSEDPRKTNAQGEPGRTLREIDIARSDLRPINGPFEDRLVTEGPSGVQEVVQRHGGRPDVTDGPERHHFVVVDCSVAHSLWRHPHGASHRRLGGPLHAQYSRFRLLLSCSILCANMQCSTHTTRTIFLRESNLQLLVAPPHSVALCSTPLDCGSPCSSSPISHTFKSPDVQVSRR